MTELSFEGISSGIKRFHLIPEVADLLLFDHHEWLVLLMDLLRFTNLFG